MAKIGEKIKEAVGAVDNISKFKKFSKLKASYVEYDRFTDSNLHEGYFCYNCIYWINASGEKCMLVEDDGPYVLGKLLMLLHHTAAVQDMRLITVNCMIQDRMLKSLRKIKRRKLLQM
jgi:hypothetical protein